MTYSMDKKAFETNVWAVALGALMQYFGGAYIVWDWSWLELVPAWTGIERLVAALIFAALFGIAKIIIEEMERE